MSLEACRFQRLTNDFLDASKVESVTNLTYAMENDFGYSDNSREVEIYADKNRVTIS